MGNILKKSDYSANNNSAYSYTAGTNKLSQITLKDNSVTTFTYDNKGNQTHRNGTQEVTYNVFNKPLTINKNGSQIALNYGADLARYKQTRTVQEAGQSKTITTHYIGKHYEVEFESAAGGTQQTRKSYLGDVAIFTDSDQDGTDIAYTHRDRLGSATTFTDHNNQVTARRFFDPFGKPRNGDWSPIENLTTNATLGNNLLDTNMSTRRGFTDHEHLDEAEIIHMNGRIYDYNVGRFMSVDPVIQSPTNTQSVNPYSYIMNNPMSGTDPSGYTSACPQGEACAETAPTGTRIPRASTASAQGNSIVGTSGAVKFNGSFAGSGNGADNTGSNNKKNGKSTTDLKGQEEVAASPTVSETSSEEQNVGDTNQKHLTSATGQKTKPSSSKFKKSAQKSLEELRKNPEFAELEKKYGTLSLTFNNDEKTGLTGNTININDSIFSLEYEVDVGGSVDAYMGTLSDSLSDDAYYAAADRYEQSLPEYNAFTMNRVIVHEAYHLMQKNVSGMEYTLNREHYEAINIRRTNQFMFKHYKEPFRSGNHGAARSR